MASIRFNFIQEDKVFYSALLASLVLHSIILFKLTLTNRHYANSSLNKLEVVYYSPKQVSALEEKISQVDKIKSIKEKKLKRNAKVLFREKGMPSHLVKDDSRFSAELRIDKDHSSRLAGLDMKKMVSVPVFQTDKINNSKYLNYRRSIRALIEQRVWAYVDATDPNFKTGQVYVSFVLLPDGSLKQVMIAEDKTNANELLREIGMRSVKEQQAFPPFPKDLDFPELPIGVVISFEVSG